MDSSKNSTKGNIIIRNWSWLLAAAITMVVLVVTMIAAGITPFGDKSLANYDCFQQYMPFFSELKYKISHKDSLLYSWNVGMGSNFLVIVSYYLSSPFNILTLIGDKYSLYTTLTIIEVLKIICSAASMGYYLSHKKEEVENNLFIVAISISYALCGYICGYYWNIIWLDSIMIFPLIILGLEHLMTGKKPYLYILTLFYSLFCNFYFSYMICLFLVLYFFKYKYTGIRDFIIKGLKFAGSSILAAGMTALTLVVSYHAISGTSTYAGTFPEPRWYGNIFSIINTHYYLTKPVVLSQFDGDANLYAGVFVILFVLIYPFIIGVGIKEKVVKIVIATFMLLSMNCSILNFLWHGFHDQYGIPNRFSILYIFLILDMAYDASQGMKEMDKKRIIPAAVIGIILPIISFFFVDYRGFISAISMTTVAFIMSFVYIVILLVRVNGLKGFVITSKLIPILMIIEVSSCAFISLKYNDLHDSGKYMDLLEARGNIIEYMNDKKDTGFYREELLRGLISDEAVFHNIKSTTVFSSSTDGYLIETNAALGYKARSNTFSYSKITPTSPFIDDMFGIRYIYANSVGYDFANYNEIYSEGGYRAIENVDALPLGYAISRDVKDIDILDSYDAAYNHNRFIKKATGLDGPYTILNPEVSAESEECQVSYDNDSNEIICSDIHSDPDSGFYTVVESFEIQESGHYYLNLQNYYIFDCYVYINGEVYTSGELACQIIDLNEQEEGTYVDIAMMLYYDGTDNIHIPTYLATYDHNSEIEAVKELSKYGLDIENFDSTHLKGRISTDGDKTLFLTIPYDKGWKLYIDGKKVDTYRVLVSYTGADLSAGDHEIEMKYTPVGFVPGVIVTIISWMVFIIIVVLFNKKQSLIHNIEDEDKLDNKDEEE